MHFSVDLGYSVTSLAMQPFATLVWLDNSQGKISEFTLRV